MLSDKIYGLSENLAASVCRVGGMARWIQEDGRSSVEPIRRGICAPEYRASCPRRKYLYNNSSENLAYCIKEQLVEVFCT